MRRFATLALSMSMLLGLSAAALRGAQDDKKGEAKAAPGQAEPGTPDEKAKAPAAEGEAKAKAQPKGEGETPPAETPSPMQTLNPGAEIPPEVQAKLEAARKAVAEAVVAAQDAGLIDSTVSPPPVLDVLLLGKVDDKATLQKVVGTDVVAGVSVEVFGAWYTGYGQLDGIVPEKNVRIVPPSKGLKAYFDTRAQVLNQYIAEARAARGAAPTDADTEPAAAPDESPKVEDTPATPTQAPAEEMKKAEESKTDEPKDEPKTEESKTEEPKPEAEESKTDEPKPEAEPKTEEPKTEEPKAEPKTEEPKSEEPKTEESKTDEPKPEAEPKTEEPKTEEPKGEAEEKSDDQPQGEAEGGSDEEPKSEDEGDGRA